MLGWGEEPLSFTQHTESFTNGIISHVGFFFFFFQIYPRTELENIEGTRLATHSQMIKLDDANMGVYQSCVFIFFFILAWNFVIASWKTIETKWKQMGSLSISSPGPTTNLRFHPFRTMAIPELIQQWKADSAKAREGLCSIPEYLYFFLTKASF